MELQKLRLDWLIKKVSFPQLKARKILLGASVSCAEVMPIIGVKYR